MNTNFSITVTNEDIDDIMVTAFEGGINYWCDRVRVEGERLGEYASDQISRGGTLKLHLEEEPDDEGEWRTLTLEKFTNGFNLWLKEFASPDRVCDENNRLDAAELDAIDADLIVQFAVFGEIIFG